MRRVLCQFVFVAAFTAGTPMGIAAPPEPTPNAILTGTYLLTNTEIQRRRQGPDANVLEYCTGIGTLDFDGNGNVLLNQTRRCMSHPPAGDDNPVTESQPLFYAVEPDGRNFVIAESPDLKAFRTHGRILMEGCMLLTDDTEQGSNFLLSLGVLVKDDCVVTRDRGPKQRPPKP